MTNILNIDETSIWFNMTENFIIDQTGEKIIHIRRIENDKN